MSGVLEVRALTRDGFEAFGDVIESEGRESFFINDGMAERFHALSRVDVGGEGASAGISLVRSRKFELPHRVDHVEYHPLGSQAFLPLDDTPFVVVVAAAGVAPEPADLRAFITDGRQGINYHRGTWHHVLLTPFAAMDFICIDRLGGGDNCVDHVFAPGMRLELAIDAHGGFSPG